MFFLYLIVSFGILIKTISYGIYEYKEKENKVGGAIVFLLALSSFIFSNVFFFYY